jgi:fido (protein-threonine AMPylation protein)
VAFEPDYGATLVTEEERGALTSDARDALGEPVRKADVYDLEQLIQDQVANQVGAEILGGTLNVADLLTDHFVRELHGRLYAPVWAWGGRQRSRETNIGIAPERIAVEMRTTLDDLRYRWEHSATLTPRVLGIAAHAALVRIHPFIDGNGRLTRLIADMVYLAAQDGEPMLGSDWWNLDRRAYIRLLGEYDRTRDPGPLAEFVPVIELPGGDG